MKRNLQVEKSEETMNLMRKLFLLKEKIKSMKLENKLLKKLRFYKGEIHKASVFQLNENAKMEEMLEKRRFICKEELKKSFNKDYSNMIERIKDSKSDQKVENNYNYIKINSKKQSEVRLLEILNTALRDEIYLNFSLINLIKKSLNIEN